MKVKHNDASSGFKTIPGQAEENFSDMDKHPSTVEPAQDTGKLYDEMNVQQMELERQNQELRKSQDSLMLAMEKYADLFNNAPVGYLATAENGRITEANLTAARMLGIDIARLTQMNLNKLVHPEDQHILADQLKKLFESGGKLDFEFRMKGRDGLFFWAHLTATMASTLHGSVVARITLNDVSGIKATEQRLSNSESNSMAILNSSLDSIFLLDRDGVVIDTNAVHAGRMGMTPQNLIGKVVFDFLPEDVARTRRENLDKVFATGLPVEGEDMRDGKVNDYRIFPIKDHTGSVKQVAVYSKDITLHKNTENELHNLLNTLENRVVERTNSLVKGTDLLDRTGRLARVGGWELDAVTHEVTWTKMVYAIHEVDPDYHPSLDEAVSFYAPEAVQVISAAVTTAIAEGKPFDLVLPFITARKNKLWVRSIGQPLLEKGTVVKISGVFQDITDLKRAQDELEKYRTHLEELVEERSRELESKHLLLIALINSPGDMSLFSVDGNYCYTTFNEAHIALMKKIMNADIRMGGNLLDYIVDPVAHDGAKQRLDRGLRGETFSETHYMEAFDLYFEFDFNPVRHNQETTGVSIFIKDVTKRKKIEDSLRESEEKWRKLVNTLPDFISLADKEGHYLFLNHYAEGYSEKDIVGRTLYDFLPDESKDIFRTRFTSCLQTGHTEQFEYVAPGNNGENRIYAGYLSRLSEKAGEDVILSIARDITEHKHSERLILSALKEKEVLLREVNHRVKNNLQVVSSLLNLQANKISDEALKGILLESRNRIRSIGLVHEKLYQSENFSRISLKEYVTSLLMELYSATVPETDKIDIRIEIEDIRIPLSSAIPFGLILNEIFSNSMKHAFPENRPSGKDLSIFISIKRMPDKSLEVIAGDTGKGFPSGQEPSDYKTLGMYLIHILATEQLSGKVELNSEDGTVYTITFKPFDDEKIQNTDR